MHPIDAPSQPLAYFTESARPLRALVRSLGMLAVVFAILNLVFLIFNVVYERTRVPAGNYSGFIRFSSNVLYPCVMTLLSFCLLMGGFGCLRRGPRGKQWLIVWAWAFLAWTVYGIVISAWYMYVSKLYSPLTFATSLGYVLQRACAGITFPLVVIVLMRHDPIRQVFDHDPSPFLP